MNDVKFEDLNITTMTLLFNIDGVVNLDTAFLLLPLTDVKQENINETKKKKQRAKTPFVDVPGSIISLRYKGLVRGYQKKKAKSAQDSKPKYFKNSVTLDLSLKDKNVNIKLCASTIHMCGAKNTNQGEEGSQYLIDYIHEISELINNNRYDIIKERLNASIDQLKRNHPNIDFSLLEDNLNMTIYKNVDTISPLKILQKSKAMVNYNYDLGFPIDRTKLKQFINGRDGFFSHYDNSTEHFVTIELPYESNIPIKNKNKIKNKILCHKFLIYKSGLVTQTGPNEDLMRPVFNLFISNIRDFWSFLYTPVSNQLLAVASY